MNRTLHTFELENIKYKFVPASRKWQFHSPVTQYTVFLPCRGQEAAHKAAKIINGSVKRCGALDGMGRAMLRKVGVN